MLKVYIRKRNVSSSLKHKRNIHFCVYLKQSFYGMYINCKGSIINLQLRMFFSQNFTVFMKDNLQHLIFKKTTDYIIETNERIRVFSKLNTVFILCNCLKSCRDRNFNIRKVAVLFENLYSLCKELKDLWHYLHTEATEPRPGQHLQKEFAPCLQIPKQARKLCTATSTR